MSLKKIASLSLVFLLIASLVFSNTVFAGDLTKEEIMLKIAAGEIMPEEAIKESDVKIKKDQAVKIAEKMLDDPDLYSQGYVSLSPYWGNGITIWSVEFNKKEGLSGSVSVAVDANTGDIVSFNAWESYDNNSAFVAKLTRDEAKAVAEKYIKEVLKEDIKNFELQNEDDPYLYSSYRTNGVKERITYYFDFVRKINNVIFPNYSINIGVDGTEGKVTSFSINRFDLDSIKFQTPKNLKTVEEALKEYRKTVDFKLRYSLNYKQSIFGPAKQKVILAYTPVSSMYMMDAVTGKEMNYDGTVIDSKAVETGLSDADLVPMDPNAKEPKSKAVNDEEVKKIAEGYKKAVEEILGVKFDENNSGNGYYYLNGSEKIWNFDWYRNEEYKQTYLNLSINANTGHVLNLNTGSYDYSYDIMLKEGKKAEEIVENVSWEQGKEKAAEVIKKLVPSQYGFYSDRNLKAPELNEEAKKYMKEYSYNYVRVVNGIEFGSNNIYVGIDRTTGNLTNFNFTWSDVEFPKVKDVIPLEEAAEKYFENMTAKLRYFVSITYDENGKQKVGDKAKLVYNFYNKDNLYGYYEIDALTGELVDWSAYDERITPLSSIKALGPHWAQRSVELLISQGILKKQDFKYDENVTRQDAVKMLALAKGISYYYTVATDNKSMTFKDVTVDDPYFVYVESAVTDKIIVPSGDKFNGKEEITKAEFIELLTNLIGYGDIAKKDEIFKLPENIEISKDKTGYAAICSVLGILPVKEGEVFKGDDKVTYAEAAQALYKALSFIK